MPERKADKQKLYFMAIIPPSPYYEEALALKQYCATQFQTKGALKSPPHITLHMPFEWREEGEQELIGRLTGFAKTQTVFDIEFDHFGSFPPRVIYIAIQASDKLTVLQRTLMHFCRSELNLVNAEDKDGAFHPHLTIAFRDLRKPSFHQAWAEFRKKKFEGRFTVNNIALLKHNGVRWEVFSRFELEGAGVNG
jgi:2'-5' RNA ligase